MITKTEALLSLRPNTIWTWRGTEYSGLEWTDSSTKPTEAEINAEVTRLQADYDSKKYQRDRAAEYPSVVDQLDKMFHSGFQAWKDEIQKLKKNIRNHNGINKNRNGRYQR